MIKLFWFSIIIIGLSIFIIKSINDESKLSDCLDMIGEEKCKEEGFDYIGMSDSWKIQVSCQDKNEKERLVFIFPEEKEKCLK